MYINIEPLYESNYETKRLLRTDFVFFTDSSTVPPLFSWDWDFGDGNGSGEQNPSHDYEEPGEYEVTLNDPAVYTRPWKMALPLYRRLEANAEILEFKCVEYSEELLYGHLRRKAAQ